MRITYTSLVTLTRQPNRSHLTPDKVILAGRPAHAIYLVVGLVITLISLYSVPIFAETDVPAEIVFKSKIKSMEKADVGPVLYPHKLHETLYECGDCHPRVFKEKIGANDVNMQENIDGKFCGASGCHNSAEAFPLYFCENCHTDVKGVAK